QRVSLAYQFDRFKVFLLLDELNVALNVYICRTRYFAGGVAVLENPEDVRRHLSVMLGDGFAGPEIAVEIVGHSNWTSLCALAAAGTPFLIHVSGPDFDLGGEVARLALKLNKFRKRQNLDVEISRTLHELG